MVCTRGAASDEDPPGPGRPRGRPRGPDRGAPAAPAGVMSFQDQKMLGIFLRLSPMAFHGTASEDAMKFLTTSKEQLHSLGLVETRGADFVAHQLRGPARQWWHLYLQSRLVGSPPVTWAQFSEAFLARFISRSVRDRLRDQFSRLEQGRCRLPSMRLDSIS